MPAPGGDSLPQELARREYDSHTEIKVTYEGEAGERIPAYLLLPRRAPAGRLPAVFAAHQCAYLCDIGKEQVVGHCVDLPDQAYGLELVREGFVVLAPDANKVGERFDERLRPQWQRAQSQPEQRNCCCAAGGSWGHPRWKPVFDVIRGLDFLGQHERVDADRIGMIGHSLGADTTLWTLPFEPRIKAAAISGTGIIREWDPTGWNPYALPFADLLCEIAPRPYFEVTGRRDPCNFLDDQASPWTEAKMARKRAAFAKARAVYAAHSRADAVELWEHDGAHSFPAEGRQRCYVWLKRWLMV
jgi:dienelactone hydrolase